MPIDPSTTGSPNSTNKALTELDSRLDDLESGVEPGALVEDPPGSGLYIRSSQ